MKQKPSFRRRRSSTKSVLRLPDLEPYRPRISAFIVRSSFSRDVERTCLSSDRERGQVDSV